LPGPRWSRLARRSFLLCDDAQNAGASPDPDFDEIIKEEAAFPYWEELDFEADLMVANPIDVAQDWITAGAKRLIIHIESFKTPADAVMAFQQLKKQLPIKDSFLYTEIGVALNPSTPNEAIEPLMEYVDFVQFMGIEKIGYQGQPFDERVIEKISSLRAVADAGMQKNIPRNARHAPKRKHDLLKIRAKHFFSDFEVRDNALN
jgi:hypothetical protein